MDETISPHMSQILTGLRDFSFIVERESPSESLEYLDKCTKAIRSMPYDSFRHMEDGDQTPMIEVWLYSMGAAKTIAIGAIELLATGIILLENARSAFGNTEGYCKAFISFLLEARAVTSQMYISFPGFVEACTYCENLFRQTCLELGVNFDRIVEIIESE